MYQVSSGFLTEVKKRNKRKIYGKLQIDWTSPETEQDVVAAPSEEARITHNTQLHDGIEKTTYKWFSLDGSCILDGTYHPAPDTESEALFNEMGWWGRTLSLQEGNFPNYSKKLYGRPSKLYGNKRLYGRSMAYPKIRLIFGHARIIAALKIVGDYQRDEYPVDFVISVYDDAGVLQHTETVTGNGGYRWEKDITAVSDVKRIEYELKKWNHAGRQAKIIEIMTSIQETYDGANIFLIDLLEEREVRDASLPIGNISANEITIRLNNIDRIFDFGNTASKLHNLVRANRKIKAWLGCEVNGEIEWVPLGTFWSGDWKVPEDDIYAETAGRDLLELMSKTEYSTSEIIQNPADTNKTFDSDAEWGAGTLTNTKVSGGKLMLDLKGV